MKKNNYIFILGAIIIAGGSFFAGMKYQENKRLNFQIMGQNGRQLGSGNFGNFQARGGMMGGFRQNGARPVAGEIMSKDDKSITVKLQDGSSRIVILSSNTAINKQAIGSKDDLKTGARVAVFGQENSDGSVTAQSVQLNPQLRSVTSTPSAK